jgi:two-component system, cell cycle sensor histidine kinase and response regulator CckA
MFEDRTENSVLQHALPDVKIILELISKGVSLEDTLNALVDYIESNSQGIICSVLLLDEEGLKLRHCAAPSLPEDYTNNIDGLEIGPDVGSCGTAAYKNKTVIVTDIANDPLWTNFKELALKHDLRACWSTPIPSSTGAVLGTFAIYSRNPGSPSTFYNLLLEQAIYLAAIAIEHGRATENLRKSEKKSNQLRNQLTEAIESLTEGFALYDSEDRLVMCNAKYLEIYNHSADLLVPGQKFEDHIRISAYRGQVPEAIGQEEEWIRKRVKQHQDPQGTYRQKLSNGRWLLISEQKTDEGGIIGVRTDITKQILFEEELKTSLNLIESIRRLLSQYMIESNPDKVFEDLLETMLGISKSSFGFMAEILKTKKGTPYLRTRAIKNFSWPDEIQKFHLEQISLGREHFNLDTLFEHILNTDEAVISTEPSEDLRLGNLAQNQSDININSFLGLPVYFQEEMIGIVCIANRPEGYDERFVKFIRPLLVTFGTILRAYKNEVIRKDNENALRISEERFSKVFSLNPMAQFIVNLDTAKLLDVNDTFLKITQHSKEEIIGKTIQDISLCADPVCWYEMIDEVKTEGLAYDKDSAIRTKYGEIRSIKCSSWLLETVNEPILLAMFKDITEQKQAEEINEQLQFQLRHSQKMKAIGQLTASVAHEFNNILVGINLNTELMLMNSENEIPEEFLGPLNDIKKSGDRAADLISQMLAFGRKKKPDKSWFNVNALITDSQRMLEQILGKMIELSTDLDPDVKPVWADEAEIEQALMNLVLNARDAMSEGGALTLTSRNLNIEEDNVSVESNLSPGSYLQLSVVDSGCGMSPETMEQIFLPFFTTKPAKKGTGLGLSTAYRDIVNNGGLLTVESQIGKGTNFRIYLPQERKKTVKNISDQSATSTNASINGTETILLCDDEETVLSTVTALLKSLGYTIISASDPTEAIEIGISYPGTISLLLTDFNMPQMNGQQLAKKITQLRPEIKVIYLSGFAGEVLDVTEGEKVEIIQKPTNIGTLSLKIRKVLDAIMTNTE